PGRSMRWLPVAFGAGIVLYFPAPREPLLWAPVFLFAALVGATIALRARPVGLPIMLGFAAAAAGFATATVKTAWIDHPVLRHPVSSVSVAGWIEVRESRERTDRVGSRVDKTEGRRPDDAPGRVRLSVRKGTAPSVGQFVELKARLNPPLAPLKPGSYDFARDLYFQGIGYTALKIQDILAKPTIYPRTSLRSDQDSALGKDSRRVVEYRVVAPCVNQGASVCCCPSGVERTKCSPDASQNRLATPHRLGRTG